MKKWLEKEVEKFEDLGSEIDILKMIAEIKEEKSKKMFDYLDTHKELDRDIYDVLFDAGINLLKQGAKCYAEINAIYKAERGKE